LARASGNSTERGHRAGYNHHRIEAGRPADEWHVHVVVGVLEDFRGKAKGQEFMIGDLSCMQRHDEVNFVFAGVDLFEQTLQINAATSAGGADHDLHR
jgi:hypothetical protein